jgi:hypothetical protein
MKIETGVIRFYLDSSAQHTSWIFLINLLTAPHRHRHY